MRLHPLIAIALVPLLVGCYRIDLSQKINADGTSVTQVQYDFTRMTGMTQLMDEEMTGSSVETKNISIISCASMAQNMTYKKSSKITCKDISTDVISYTIQAMLPRSALVIRKTGQKTVYLYRAADPDAVVDANTGFVTPEESHRMSLSKQMESSSESSSSASLTPEQEKLFAPEGTFQIEMPAPVTRTTIGKIQGNTVTFSINVLIARKRLVIWAEGQ